MTFEELKSKAASIKTIGSGSAIVGKYVQNCAEKMTHGLSIVDIACGFGYETARLALGLIKSRNLESVIHAYDIWKLDYHMAMQVNKKYKTSYQADDQFYDEFFVNMSQFAKAGVKIESHIGDISLFNGSCLIDKQIGILVDDICSGKEKTDHMIRTFLPRCVPGETLFILMDHFYFNRQDKWKRYGERHLKYQYNFFHENAGSFKFIRELKGTRTGVYRYIGNGIKDIKFISE